MVLKLTVKFVLLLWVCVFVHSETQVHYQTISQNDTYLNHTKHEDNHTNGHKEICGVAIAGWKFPQLREHFIFTIVVLIAGLSKVGFHFTDKLSSLVPESCLLIIIGTIFGALFLLTGVSEKLPEFFTPDAFFYFLLPPIILEAAFSLYDRTFLQNLGSILIFSVAGTCFAAFTIGLCLIGLHHAGAMEAIDVTPIQLLVFSSLIVAVDPVAVLAVFNEVGVNRVLYFLVFGESLLNDGVTVVLYNVLQSYNSISLQGGSITAKEVFLGFIKFFVVCFGGLFIGVIIGILSSLLTKYTNTVKVVEPVAIFGMAYLAYILAEIFLFSGIISIIACGLIQVAYAFNNLNRKSCIAIKYFSRVMSTITEILIFMFLGLLLVRKDHDWQTGFILWSLVLCVVVRFLYTYLFSVLINKFDSSRVRRITMDEMFIMSYGGLRGAVCFSLVALLKREDFPTKNLFVTTTLVIILFTVFVQGATIKPLVNKLRVKLATYVEPKMYDELNCKVTDHMMAGMEEIVGHEGNFYLMEKMKRFQDVYLRKFLLKDPDNIDQQELLQYYEKLVMKEHYKNLFLCGAQNMTEKADNMRNIDSSAILLKLASGEDVDESKEEKPEVRRRIKSNEEPTPSEFRRLMETHACASRMPKIEQGQRFCSTIPQGMFNRDMAQHSQFSMMQHLQNKRTSNMRLQKMKSQSITLHRALSWSEDNSALCIKRASEKNLNARFRSQTVDISPGENGTSFDSQLVDTVFEEDEVEANHPLLVTLKGENKVSTSSSEPKAERSGITVMTHDTDGDTICFENNYVPSYKQTCEQTIDSTGTASNEEPEDSKLDKMVSRKNIAAMF